MNHLNDELNKLRKVLESLIKLIGVNPPHNRPKSSNTKRNSTNPQSNPSSAPIPKTLILVVNPLKKDCLDKIKSQKNKILIEDCEKLYRATSYLWIGDKSEISSNFKNDQSYKVIEGEESEYDVYFIEITLSQANDGFKEDVTQLNRIDAFRQLTNCSVKNISPRLKVSIYKDTNVYCL